MTDELEVAASSSSPFKALRLPPEEEPGLDQAEESKPCRKRQRKTHPQVKLDHRPHPPSSSVLPEPLPPRRPAHEGQEGVLLSGPDGEIPVAQTSTVSYRTACEGTCGTEGRLCLSS